jgi:hypothetical protein
MSLDPAPPPRPPTEPRRSSRRRFKSAAAAEADMSRARAEVEAEMALDGADRDAPTGYGLQSTAAKEKPRKRKRAAKEKVEERAEAQEPAAADDYVCTEEPDSEEMVEEELEEAAAALEAEEEEEEAKAGGGWSVEKVGTRKRVALPSTERRADASEDHFVGEPVPDHEARQRWPERYKTKVRRRFSQHADLFLFISKCRFSAQYQYYVLGYSVSIESELTCCTC